MKAVHNYSPASTTIHADVKPWRVAMVLLPMVVLGLSLFTVWRINEIERHNVQTSIEAGFDSRAREIANIFKERLNTCEQVLYATVGLFASSREVTSEEFYSFVSHLPIGRVQGLQGVGFIQAPGLSRPDGRSQLLYFEPRSRTLAVPGADPLAEPSRRPALFLARDSGEVSVADKRKLPGEDKSRIEGGYRMYLPVYRNNVPTNTVEARRAALIGWVFAAFTMDGLLTNIQGERRDIAVDIYDGSDMADDTLLFDSQSDRVGGESELMLLRRAIAVEVGGYGWTVTAQTLPTLETTLALENLRLRKIGGSAVSLLVAWLTWLALRWRVRILMEREAKYHEERRQFLSEERERLMQDMHDGLGLSLVSALRVVEHGKFNKLEIASILRSCIDDLKLTIDSMEPVEDDLLLLLATLRFRLEPRLENAGIKLRWDIRDVPPLPWLTPKYSLHILRILQEAFTNIMKHADASEISVATRVADDSYVEVSVTDNGRGFDVVQAESNRGKGFMNQRRRAEVLRGEVGWKSNSTGTRFTLWLPIH